MPGHYCSGMLDIYSDFTQQVAHFGGHIEILEVDELSALRRHVTEPEVQARVARFQEVFDVQPDCSAHELAQVEIHPMGGSLRYDYDIATLVRKVLGDIRASQTASGLIPATAPEYVKFEGGGMFRATPEFPKGVGGGVRRGGRCIRT